MNLISQINPAKLIFSKFVLPYRGRERVGQREGFEDITFYSGDGCRLEGWVHQDRGGQHARGTLILLHGYTGDCLNDLDLACELARRHHLTVLAFDHRHHGLSEHRLPTFGRQESYDVMAAMDEADTRGLAQPYILLGTSLGGLAAQNAAFDDGRVAGVFLISAPATAWDAIGTCVGPLTPLAQFINATYGWDVLTAGNICTRQQKHEHFPHLVHVIGNHDHYDVRRARAIFDHWHAGLTHEHQVLKQFEEIPGAVHPGSPGPQVHEWDGFRPRLDTFIEAATA